LLFVGKGQVPPEQLDAEQHRRVGGRSLEGRGQQVHRQPADVQRAVEQLEHFGRDCRVRSLFFWVLGAAFAFAAIYPRRARTVKPVG